jgi:hypothetical protein
VANEIRVRRNNMAGAITDNPLSSVATTINSATFSDLPVIDATNHLILILDPLESAGPAEIVRVTAHTAAATSVTVVRAVEGSSARSHILGTTWYHGPVTSDTIEVLTSATRPSTPYEGQAIFETDTNKLLVWAGVDWAPRDAGGQLASGYAQVTTNQTNISGAGVDLTGLSVTVTVGTSRRIKITGYGQMDNEVVGANFLGIRIQESTTVLGEALVGVGNSGTDQQFATLNPIVIITPSAGLHTYKLLGFASTGAANILRASATNPAFILVEDIGAA